MSEQQQPQPEKRFREEDEFFEGEHNERPTQQSEQEPLWLTKRREWLRNLNQKDRDFISRFGFDLWEKTTGRKRDV
jgi:hypothetical protein